MIQMYYPERRDVVTLEGVPDAFQVLWVNRERGSADLLALKEETYVLANVSFARLHSLEEEAASERG